MSSTQEKAKIPDDARVVEYWKEIASAWITTVRSGGIATRELVTNRAIIDAVTDRSPASILDVGCGEGWLCRAIAEKGIRVTGVDAVPDLIERARAAGGGDYHLATYEDLAAGVLSNRADVVVCNFSLLGKESVEGFMAAVRMLMTPGGALVVQTLHPLLTTAEEPYVDGWRESSWTGISGQISEPSPWYFRTLGSWVRLFSESGLRLVELREPLHPDTGRPASVIFVAS